MHKYAKSEKEHLSTSNTMARRFNPVAPDQAWCGDCSGSMKPETNLGAIFIKQKIELT